MDLDKDEIKPGEDGHPGIGTYKGTAWMKKIDGGKYEFIKRRKDFLEVVLHGKEYKGRYLFREIDVVNAKMEYQGGEDDAKNEKIWIMWKPAEQKVNMPVKKLAYKFNEEYKCLTYWETEEEEIIE